MAELGIDQAVDFKVKSWVQALTGTSPSFVDVMSPPGVFISHTVKEQFLCVDMWWESKEVTYLASRRHIKPTEEEKKKKIHPGLAGQCRKVAEGVKTKQTAQVKETKPMKGSTTSVSQG